MALEPYLNSPNGKNTWRSLNQIHGVALWLSGSLSVNFPPSDG